MIFQIFELFDRASRFFIPFLGKEILYSGILFMVIIIFLSIMKKLSPQWHLGLWLLVLIRLVLPPDLSCGLSGRNLLNQFFTAHSTSDYYYGFVEEFPSEEQSFSNTRSSGIDYLSEKQTIPWYIIFFTTWMTGSVIFLFIYLRKLTGYHRLLKRASPVRNRSANQILQSWRVHFRIWRTVRLVCSDDYLSPFTVGIFRPVIFLPKRLIELDSENLLESIIAHEIAHVKRFDDLWIKFQNIIQIFYFFYPVIWFANSRIHLARECVCDSMVLSRWKDSKKVYGYGLLTVLKLNLLGSKSIGLIPGFGSDRKKLLFRLRNINKMQVMGKFQPVIILTTILLLGLLLLPMAGSTLQNQEKNNTKKQSNIFEQEKHIKFIAPTRNGKVYLGFGDCIDPKTKEHVFHRGVDIIHNKKASVFASAEGIVLGNKKDNLLRKSVFIQHLDGYQTTYFNLDTSFVYEGKKVTAGEQIGLVGHTKRSTGSHLHFEISQNGKVVDPIDYIDFEFSHSLNFDDKETAQKTSIDFIKPIHNGRISSRFGYRIHPITKRLTPHKGIDIAMPRGTPVLASACGMVQTAEFHKSYGNYIILQHTDMYKTIYAMLDTIYVYEGQEIRSGEHIGDVGSTGRYSTGPHLYFEVRKNDEQVNPEYYIDF